MNMVETYAERESQQGVIWLQKLQKTLFCYV